MVNFSNNRLHRDNELEKLSKTKRELYRALNEKILDLDSVIQKIESKKHRENALLHLKLCKKIVEDGIIKQK